MASNGAARGGGKSIGENSLCWKSRVFRTTNRRIHLHHHRHSFTVPVAFSFHPMISRSSSPPSPEQHFRIGGDGHWNASLFLFCPATTTHPANRGRPPRSPDPTGFGPAVSRAAPGRVGPLFGRSWFFGMVERRYSRRHQDNSTRSDRLARSRD